MKYPEGKVALKIQLIINKGNKQCYTQKRNVINKDTHSQKLSIYITILTKPIHQNNNSNLVYTKISNLQTKSL